jgi:hypothetical protein
MSLAARRLSVVNDSAPAKKTPRTPAKAPQTSRSTKKNKEARRREEYLSLLVGCGCLVGLALSGIDSTFALNAFIKVPMWRAAMLAIVIDGLMVGAELATLLSPCPNVKKTAYLYISMSGLLSIGLNAAEFASHGDVAGEKVLNGIVGGLIPLLVLISSRYAGHLYLSSK